MMNWRECTADEEKRKFLEEAVEDVFPGSKGEEDATGYYRTAVVLFAAMMEGTNVTRLTDLTGYPKEFIAAISLNMREAELWVEDEVCNEHWFEGDLAKPQSICCDVLVAEGKLIRRRRNDGEFVYRVAQPC
jgi:hypothetical protein